jgi:hypothetical protein
MKGLKAKRIRFKIGSVWESPALHILLAKENDVVVARCLDFTVSSHAKDEKGALKALADSIKEYVLNAVENDAIDTIFDPAHGKYWRMYNERPLHNVPFRPISVSGSNFNPRNTQCIPVVKIFAFLELERN